MRIKTRISPSMEPERTGIPYSRQKWERDVYKWVKKKTPCRDECDLLAIVSSVLEKAASIDIEAKYGDTSVAKFLKTLSEREVIRFERKWAAEGKTPELQPFSSGASGRAEDSPCSAVDDTGWISRGNPGDIGEDPADIYERKESGEDQWSDMTPEMFVDKYGLDKGSLPIIKCLSEAVHKSEILKKLGLTDKQYRDKLYRIRKKIKEYQEVTKKGQKRKVSDGFCAVCAQDGVRRRVGRGLTYFCDWHNSHERELGGSVMRVDWSVTNPKSGRVDY